MLKINLLIFFRKTRKSETKSPIRRFYNRCQMSSMLQSPQKMVLPTLPQKYMLCQRRLQMWSLWPRRICEQYHVTKPHQIQTQYGPSLPMWALWRQICNVHGIINSPIQSSSSKQTRWTRGAKTLFLWLLWKAAYR